MIITASCLSAAVHEYGHLCVSEPDANGNITIAATETGWAIHAAPVTSGDQFCAQILAGSLAERVAAYGPEIALARIHQDPDWAWTDIGEHDRVFAAAMPASVIIATADRIVPLLARRIADVGLDRLQELGEDLMSMQPFEHLPEHAYSDLL